jgi:hypothetical protein
VTKKYEDRSAECHCGLSFRVRVVHQSQRNAQIIAIRMGKPMNGRNVSRWSAWTRLTAVMIAIGVCKMKITAIANHNHLNFGAQPGNFL